MRMVNNSTVKEITSVLDYIEPIETDPFPFRVRALVPVDVTPRHPMFNEILDESKEDIECVLQGFPLNKSELLFCFPERWMGPIEQKRFLEYLAKHPDAKHIRSVDLVTQSDNLIQNLTADKVGKWAVNHR